MESVYCALQYESVNT